MCIFPLPFFVVSSQDLLFDRYGRCLLHFLFSLLSSEKNVWLPLFSPVFLYRENLAFSQISAAMAVVLSHLVHGSKWNFSWKIHSWYRTNHFHSLARYQQRPQELSSISISNRINTSTHTYNIWCTIHSTQYIIEIDVHETHTHQNDRQQRKRFPDFLSQVGNFLS